MASSKTQLALFLLFNLVFFSSASANSCPSILSLASLVVCSVPGVACCSCYTGISDPAEAADCLCAAIKLNICVLGIGVDASAYIKLALKECGYHVPSSYFCS